MILRLLSRSTRFLVILVISAAFLALSFGQALAQPAVATPVSMSCPFNNEGGDFIDRGFYITGFPGDRLDTVTLQYFPGDLGVGTIQLTAHLSTYDGAVIGSATVSSDFSSGTQMQTYDFGSAYVPVNSTIAFVQTVTSGQGLLYYDTGNGPCPGFTETEATTPPLDTFRRDSIGAIITGQYLGTIPSGYCLPLPEGSVVGAMPLNTQAYFAPGEIAEGVIINAGTYWVLGVDESGQYYKILLACQYLWVPVDSMGPSYQAPWTGQPLPTQVVS